MSSVQSILQQLSTYKNNPAAIQGVVLDHLRNISDGKIDIVDPTNPLVFLLESAAVCTASFNDQNLINSRRQYPALSQTSEDLYLHMSDIDFKDRFATPASTKFSILMSKTELLTNIVQVPGTNYKKITIPRNTEFIVADVVFSLQYPIDIIQHSHGEFQVLYDNSKLSPLKVLTTNRVNFETRKNTITFDEWFYIEVDVDQFQISTYTNTIVKATGFNHTYSFTDKFYYARVWNKSSLTNNEWVELKTTHTDQVYNINTPTAVLSVIDRDLTVTIPQIYLNQGDLTGSVRVDIYTTKGEISLVLENYKPSSFETNWKAIDPVDQTQYVAALSNFTNIFAYSTKTVIGGKDEIGFQELKQRVINNSIGDQQIPITNVQIETALANKGYTIVKDVDVVTNRVFLATKQLPKPIDEKLITAASASIETIVTSMEDIGLHSNVFNNGARITIAPENIYRFSNGITRILTDAEITALKNQSPAMLAETVNGQRLLYSPFHYVLDSNSGEFELRPYYLDSCNITSISFVEQNTLTGLQINTEKTAIKRINDGYRLTITSVSNDAIKALSPSQIKVYLAFTPVGENNKAFMKGIVSTNSNSELVIDFYILTKFDIDSNNTIYLDTFKMFDLTNRSLGSTMTKDFDLIYCVDSNVTSAPNTTIDNILSSNPIDTSVRGVTRESIRVFFGDMLSTLWSRSRSIASALPYKVHTNDQIKVYQEDVYEKDSVTGSIFKIVNGQIVYNNLLHRRGDPIKDASGNILYEYRRGDVVKDSLGRPVPENPNKIMRQLDLLFIDACYYFATDSAAVSYKKLLTSTLVDWMMIDLVDISKKLLDQTKIYFYPKTNIGTIRALVDNSLVTSMEAMQSLSVTLYVNSTVFNNIELRQSLTRQTIKAVDSMLQNSVITVSKVINELTTMYADEVISVSVDGLGGSSNVKTISILQENERCSLQKKLTVLPNNDLIVEEAISVNFILHEKT